MSWLDALNGSISLFQALLPLLEKKLALLPVNPGIRENVLVISIVLAAVAGGGGYVTTRRLHKPSIPWSSLAIAFTAVGLMFALTAGMHFGMGPLQVSVSVGLLYVAIFTSIGIAVGGFLGLT